MDENQFIWEHFKFNADQRLKGFNFFVLLSIFANGGVFTALEKGLAPILLVILGLFIVMLSVVFCLVDIRSQRLLALTVPALIELETSFSPSSRLFSIDAAQRGKYVRYTTAIRILHACQFVFGAGVALYAVYAAWW